MKIRIFNPEHDIALALNRQHVTPPHAARQLQADYDFLPAFFADDDDYVLVGDIKRAKTNYEHYCSVCGKALRKVIFVTAADIVGFAEQGEVLTLVPWGMDGVIVDFFRRMGFVVDVAEDRLARIREISSRQWCVENLQDEAVYVSDINVIRAKVSDMRCCVLKSLWSSSGRGVRYIDLDNFPNASADVFSVEQNNWVGHIIRQQGGIVIEPFYNKVKDFGLEFEAFENGDVKYLGLSLFETEKRSYTGGLLANEDDKREILERYISEKTLVGLIDKVKRVMSPVLKDTYSGLFGVDFMIVTGANTDAFDVKIAEINLRCTMGHVALTLSPTQSMPPKLMRTEFDGGHYHLRINAKSMEEEA